MLLTNDRDPPPHRPCQHPQEVAEGIGLEGPGGGVEFLFCFLKDISGREGLSRLEVGERGCVCT